MGSKLIGNKQSRKESPVKVKGKGLLTEKSKKSAGKLTRASPPNDSDPVDNCQPQDSAILEQPSQSVCADGRHSDDISCGTQNRWGNPPLPPSLEKRS